MRKIAGRAPMTSQRAAFLLASLLVLLLVFAVVAAGCSESTGEAEPVDTTPQTKTVARWPDVPVSADTVQAEASRLLGKEVAPKITSVRSAKAEETTPGHFKLIVNYNQPGMCHSSGGTANWQVSLLQQYAYLMLMMYFKQPQVDVVELEAYATPDPNENDPQKFEKVARIVVERVRTTEATWGADRAHATIPNFATEYWVTPKAI